jgi:hypothetical protein
VAFQDAHLGLRAAADHQVSARCFGTSAPKPRRTPAPSSRPLRTSPPPFPFPRGGSRMRA